MSATVAPGGAVDTGPAPPAPAYGLALLAYRQTTYDEPKWVVEYDPDGGDPDVPYPTGYLRTSHDSERAQRFATQIEAAELWRKVSTRTPLRPDGRPNRPLSAFTVEIRQIP